MPDAIDLQQLTWEQFELLCARLLQEEGFEVAQHVRPGQRSLGVDLLAQKSDGRTWCIELKHTAGTRFRPLARLRRDLLELENAREFLGADEALLVVSGRLDGPSRSLLVSMETPRLPKVWDRMVLEDLLSKHLKIVAEFLPLLAAQQRLRETVERPDQPEGLRLLDELRAIPAGRSGWKNYEDVCIRALNYAFIPPLRNPRIQSRSEDGLDVRDAVYSIGSGNAFWTSLRSECRTRFVVAEFKNYDSEPTQTAIESLQQYLYPAAMRSFGMLCTRQPVGKSGLLARRRAWVESAKLIVFLNDDSLEEIIKAKMAQGEPSDIIDLQLDEFFEGLSP